MSIYMYKQYIYKGYIHIIYCWLWKFYPKLMAQMRKHLLEILRTHLYKMIDWYSCSFIFSINGNNYH